MPSAYRSPSGRFVEWARLIADARRRPDQWWLALPDEPARLVDSIQQRRHPVLREMVGRLEARADAAAPTRDGQVRANISVRYTHADT